LHAVEREICVIVYVLFRQFSIRIRTTAKMSEVTEEEALELYGEVEVCKFEGSNLINLTIEHMIGVRFVMC
jgi:hypothetical protein